MAFQESWTNRVVRVNGTALRVRKCRLTNFENEKYRLAGAADWLFQP